MVVVRDSAPRSDALTAKARAFCLHNDVDALGVFRIPSRALDTTAIHPAVAGALPLFVPRLSGGDGLSRGERYYDIRSALLAWPALVAACRVLAAGEAEAGEHVTLALYENLFNVVAAMTFSYWEHCCDEPDHAGDRLPVLEVLVASLPRLARLHLGAAVGGDLVVGPSAIDWERLERVGSQFPREWRLRRLREFDNKARVLNEALYLGREVQATWRFEAALFPMYGALTLAAYFSAVQPSLAGASGADAMPLLLVRLGVYDRGPTSFRTKDGALDIDRLLPRAWRERTRQALAGRRVLVVDDNAATGRTLRACREFVLECGAAPLTRSAETSWELLRPEPPSSACFDGVDLPGLRTNMSYAVHCALTDLLVRRRCDEYAASVARMSRASFPESLLENYRTARRGHGLVPHQRASVEHEWAHARHWREPGYPAATPPPDRSSQLRAWDGFPAGVRPWLLGEFPADVDGFGDTAPGALFVVGTEALVLAAGSVTRLTVGAPGAGLLRLCLGGWSAEVLVAGADRNQVDVEVLAPAGAGAHQLVLRLTDCSGVETQRRYPVHVVAPSPVRGAVRFLGGGATAAARLRTGVDVVEAGAERTPLVIGEGDLGPGTRPVIDAALAVGATVVVLAQEPHASANLPLTARIEPITARQHSAVRFTTAHHALASLPRHRLLSFEDAAVRPAAVFTRVGRAPWCDEVAVGFLALDGSMRGTVVGAHVVGVGLLIVCQLPLVQPVRAGHPGARAILADLLRWAISPRRPLTREDVVLPDGRSISFYPVPDCAS